VLIGILVAAALVGGASGAALVWSHPALDPSSPRTALPAARAVEHELRRDGVVARVLRSRLDPKAATGLLLTIGLVVAALLGILVVQVRSGIGIVSIDRSINRWADAHATSLSDDVLHAVTNLGSTVGVVVVGLVVTWFAGRGRFGTRNVFRYLLVIIAGQWIVTQLIKLGVDRTRPVLGITAGLDGSFPSGHSAAAAATYTACALVLGIGRSRQAQAALTGAAVGIAFAVATSRVLLGLHWFSDVIGGLALGWAWFALVSLAFGGRLLRFGTPIEVAERHEELVDSATLETD
jgi:membrane-associated phospholipid phosphatase